MYIYIYINMYIYIYKYVYIYMYIQYIYIYIISLSSTWQNYFLLLLYAFNLLIAYWSYHLLPGHWILFLKNQPWYNAGDGIGKQIINTPGEIFQLSVFEPLVKGKAQLGTRGHRTSYPKQPWKPTKSYVKLPGFRIHAMQHGMDYVSCHVSVL